MGLKCLYDRLISATSYWVDASHYGNLRSCTVVLPWKVGPGFFDTEICKHPSQKSEAMVGWLQDGRFLQRFVAARSGTLGGSIRK